MHAIYIYQHGILRIMFLEICKFPTQHGDSDTDY